MKFSHKLLHFMTNISKLFLILLQGLDISSGPIYDFDKMTMYDLLLFGRWRLLFLIVSVPTFKRVKNHTHSIWFLTMVGW